MNALKQLWIVMCTALIFVLTAGVAKAEVGFDVLSATAEVVTVRVHGNVSPRTLSDSYGASFKEATGVDFLSADGYERMFSLNSGVMMTACRHPGDGASHVNSSTANVEDHLAIWAACDKKYRELWYKPETVIKIPVSKGAVVGETFTQMHVRRIALDACTDLSCIKANTKSAELKKTLDVVPTAALNPATPSTTADIDALKNANIKIATLEQQLAQANKAPAAIVTPSQTVGQWSPRFLDLLLLVLCAGAFSVYYHFKIKPITYRLVTLIQERTVDSAEFHGLEEKHAIANCAKVELEGLANEFVVMMKGGPFRSNPDLSYREMATKIREILTGLVAENNRLQGDLDAAKQQFMVLDERCQQAQTNAHENHAKATQFSADLEAKQLECTQAVVKVADCEQQVIALTRELDAAKNREEMLSAKRGRYVQLSGELAPHRKDLRNAYQKLQGSKLKVIVFEELSKQAVAKGEPISAQLREDIENSEKEANVLQEQIKTIRANMRFGMREQDEIQRKLLGSPDPDVSLILEATALHDEALEAHAIALKARADAEIMSNQSRAGLEALLAQQAEFGDKVQEHQAREVALRKSKDDLAEERMAFDEFCRADREAIANRKAGLNHLLDDACETLGLERSMSVESILKLNGASGLLYEASKRTKAAEERVADLTSKLDALAVAREAAEVETKEVRCNARILVEDLEMQVSSLRAENEAYSVLKERRSEALPDQDPQTYEDFEDTGSWGLSERPSPITQPMGIRAVQPPPPEKDEEDENPLAHDLSEVRAAEEQRDGDTKTLRGTQKILNIITASRPPSAEAGNGTSPRKNTLDGIVPPTSSVIRAKLDDLTTALKAVNSHQDKSADRMVLDRAACLALDDFLRRPYSLDQEMQEIALSAIERDSSLAIVLASLKVQDLPKSLPRLGIKFPKKTLRPPGPPPSSSFGSM